MSILNKTLLSLLFLAFMISPETKANHENQMFELNYRWVSDSTYQVTVVFFVKCATTSVASSISVSLNSATKSIGLQRPLHLTPVVGPGVPPHVLPNLYNCSPTSTCFEEYVYRGNITVPAKARDWTFSYQLCCYTQTNYDNVDGDNRYAEAGLNNLDFPDQIHRNSSPLWHNRRPDYPGFTNDTIHNHPFFDICAGRTITLFQQAREYNGDRVRYSHIATPTSNNNTTATYKTPYSLNYILPVDTPPGFRIDSLSGQVLFVPKNGAQTPSHYMTTIRADEYRFDTTTSPGTWIRIGHVIRNLYITVSNDSMCSDTTIALSSPSNPNLPANLITKKCSDNEVMFSTSLPIKCNSVDTNGSFAILIDSITNTPLTLKAAEAVNCDPVGRSQTIRLQTASALNASATYYLILKHGTDGNTLTGDCGSEIPPYRDTMTIRVLPVNTGTLMGHHMGNGVFASEIYGDCHDQELLVNFSQPVMCNSLAADGSDFVLYELFPPFQSIFFTNAQPTFCVSGLTETATLTAVTKLPAGLYRLELKAGTDANTLINECQDEWGNETIVVSIAPPAVYLGQDTFYCKGQSFQYTLNAGSGFSDYQWNTGNASDTLQTLTINSKGTYIVFITTPEGCESSDTIHIAEVDCNTGFNNHAMNEISIFPNPASGNIFIRSSADWLAVSILDVTGKIHQSSKVVRENNHFELDISNLNTGLYFVTVKVDGERSITKRLVVR